MMPNTHEDLVSPVFEVDIVYNHGVLLREGIGQTNPNTSLAICSLEHYWMYSVVLDRILSLSS